MANQKNKNLLKKIFDSELLPSTVAAIEAEQLQNIPKINYTNNENYRIVARDPFTNNIRLGNQSITPPIYDGPMTPEFSGQRIPFDQANPDQRSMEMMNNPPANEPVMPLPPTTQQNEGMPGFGSMPMNMGLLQLGAGLLAQSGWQDEDISPGQALGRAMPGAVSSYMSGVKALQDRDLYKSKMQDILDARNRRKGLQEDLPGVIDNLKGKISGIPDARLDVIKTLVKSAPEQAAQIVSNLASQASKGKFTYRLANDAEIASGINPGTMMEVDPTNDKVKIFNKKPGEIKVNEIPGGVYLSQDGVFKQTLSTGSKASEKTDLEMADSRPWATLEKYRDTPNEPAYRAAYGKLSNRLYDVPDPNDPSRTIRVKLPLEGYPEPGSPAASTSGDGLPFSVDVSNLGTGTAIFEKIKDDYKFPGNIDDFVDYLNQNVDPPPSGAWTKDIMPSEIPIKFGVTKSKAGKEVLPGKNIIPTERQGKVISYARQFSDASEGIDKLYQKGYRPGFKVWNNILSSIEENRNYYDSAIVQELLPGTQLQGDDKEFARHVLTIGTRSIRALSGAALKGSELRDELQTLFPIVRLGSAPNSAELEKTFRDGRLRALEGLLDETGGRLPKVREKLGRYRSYNPFNIKSGDALKNDLIKEFNLER